MASLPYTTAIASYADIQALERDIQQLMRCKGNTCAFLQSAEYKTLTFAMTRGLMSKTLPADQKIHIPHSNMVMHVSRDMKICIQSVAPEVSEDTERDDVPKKRRRV